MRRSQLYVALGALAVLTASCSSDSATSTATPDADVGETTTTVDAYAAPPGEVASAEPTPSIGCGVDDPPSAVSLERRTLAGSDRWYLLTVPPAHDGTAPLPLVLDFHGLSEGAELHAGTSGFGPYAEEHGLIAVFPNGTGAPVRWEGGSDRSANADLVFVDALLDELEASLCVDTSRVYATGFSNGALFSSVIACTMAERVTAVAPMAGVNVPASCEGSRPVPMIGFHGTADPILLFNGGVGDRLGRVLGGGGAGEEEPLPEADLDGDGYPANAAAWAARNGCEPEPSDSDLTPSVIERTWTCPSGTDVVFEIMVGAGHSWPGSEFTKSIEQIVGPTDMSIDGTDMMWRFFQRFALPQA
ncbi:MAG: alpha/beta hydrolase family esterase [Actinomycetota bacterium]